jgi:hypothetical protein
MAPWPAQRRALPNPADLARIRCSVLARSPRACTGLPATVFCDLQTSAALDPNSRWGGWAPHFRRTGSPEPPPRSSSVRGSHVKVSTGCCTGFSAWALLLIPAGSASAGGPRRHTIRCTLASDNAGANVAFLGAADQVKLEGHRDHEGGNAVVDPRESADDTDRAGLLNRQEPRASESRSCIRGSNQSPLSIDLPRPWCRQA